MINEEYKYTVNSTWLANEDSVCIKDIISLEDANNSEWSQINLGDISQLEDLYQDDNLTPLLLMRQNPKEPCSLRISLEDTNIKIMKVIVISEARIIEFYGNFGEYLVTEKASFLGNMKGKKFYIAQPNICKASETTLKFCESGDTLWLYGISLLVTHCVQPTNNSNIDFANVEQILRTSNIHLTENAERAKDFIKNYNITKSNGHTDSEMLQNLIQQWNSLSCDSNKALSTKAKLSLNSPNIGNSNSFAAAENGNEERQDNSHLKEYVDLKIQQLEEKIQSSIQVQLQEFEHKQNEKLDHIVELLKKK